MALYRFGDILLLSFPFTDSAGSKRRPALVLLDTGDADVLVARITTQSARTSFDMDIADWRQAGLLGASIVRVDKLATLDKALIERQIGALTDRDRIHITEVLRKLLTTIA